MKKRVFTRILIVALVCTMLLGLVGFAPMVETAAASAGEQKVAAAANDGGTSGEVKDQPEQEQPTPTPAPTPAPTQEPEPEPTDDPQPGMCKVTIEQPDGGTITCAELPESGQVKAGTKLTFTVSEDKNAVSSTFRKAAVNGKVVEDVKGGKFAVVVEENITVTAEFFGIQSVTVSGADKWTRSKTVTVKTIGSVDSMTYQTTDGEAVPFDRSFEVTDEIGEKPVKYTITVNGGGQTAETTVEVSKIDSKAPKAKYTFKGNKKITGTVTVTDETQISAPVTFTYTGWIADKETPVSSGVLNYTKRNTYEFTAPRYTKDKKEIRYTVSGQDEAGNVAIFNGNAGIVCDVLDGVADSACAWVGGKSKIRVILAGIPVNNLNVEATYDGQASKEPLFKNDKTLKDYVQPSGEIEIPISALNIAPYTLTTYRFSCVSCEDSEAEVTVKYDPDAPVLNPEPTYVFTNTSAESRILHFLSFGLLFNKQIEFTFDAKDIYRIPGSDELQASGIAAVQYSTDDDKSEDSWRDMECERKDGLFHYTCSFDGKFTGSIYVRAIDNVGNVTSPAEVKFNGKSITISNEGTTVSDNGVLSVYTTTDRNDEEKPYAGEWANNVTFTAITQQDENISSVRAVYVKDGKEHAIEMTKADDGSGAYYGVLNNEVYAGPVTITAYKKAEVTDAEVNASATDNPVASVDISVKVQNNIDLGESVKIKSDQKTVELNSDEPIWWFNSNDNILNKAKIDELTSLAPYAVYWKLERATVNDPDKFVQIDYGVYGNMTEKKYKELYEDFEGSGFQKEYQCTSEPALDLKSKISETGIYRLSVRPVDEARNIAENWSDYTFKYDATAPMIKADFKDVMQPSANGKYYNIQRIVTISVTDEGFTGTEKLTGAEKITCASGGAEALPKKAWTWKTDHWECQYSYGVASGDARDGDDYKLTVSVTDNAGNTASTDANGTLTQNEKVVKNSNRYTGAGHGNDFTIDQTKPVVSVRFDNNNVRNGKYFSAGRTATITVTEHNFSTENVEMTATNATVGGSASEGWSQNGDVWTKTVTFDPQDAVCEFSISVTDLAGNTCTNDEVNYGDSAAHGEFVIDQVNPTLNITGTDASPYADDCAPGFTAHDTNMSAEYTMTLDRTVRASRNENVSDRFLTRDSVSVTGTDINAVFHTITQEAENDGIYVLNVTVMDMAGNSTQTTSTFTVNRHGSFYVFNEALADVVNAKYVQKADGSYQVTEYNASPLVGDSVKIEIYRDGQLVTTLTPAIGAGVIGASGLYEYTYDLPAEHFAQNGRYRVALSSVDEAKNESDNTKLDDALLEFTVDSVAPEITMIKGLEKGIVNAKSLDFTASVMDTYGIASVQILVDGKVVKEYVTQEAYDKLTADGRTLDHEYAVLTNTLDFNAECTLLESSSRQHVAIVVTDMAGNVTQTDSKDFAPAYDFHDSVLVSTNFWARYTHNVWALIVTGVVILAVAGGVWYVTAKKKKEQMAA